MNDSAGRSEVAVVGLGAMGSRIAARLLAHGYEILVWNRSPHKTEPLLRRGALAATTPAHAAGNADVVITMVADPAALREVTEGPDGILAGLRSGTTMIEMSTVGREAIERLVELGPRDDWLLDAPVLGSLTEVESASLSIFIGGPKALVERHKDLFDTLGTPVHVGPLGNGAAAKLVANSTLLGLLGLLTEAVALSDALGLPREVAFAVLDTSPLAPQAKRRRPTIENQEPDVRFALSLARKDADLVVRAAADAGIDLPMAEAQLARFTAAERAGFGERDYSTVIAWVLRQIERRSPGGDGSDGHDLNDQGRDHTEGDAGPHPLR